MFSGYSPLPSRRRGRGAPGSPCASWCGRSLHLPEGAARTHAPHPAKGERKNETLKSPRVFKITPLTVSRRKGTYNHCPIPQTPLAGREGVDFRALAPTPITRAGFRGGKGGESSEKVGSAQPGRLGRLVGSAVLSVCVPNGEGWKQVRQISHLYAHALLLGTRYSKRKTGKQEPSPARCLRPTLLISKQNANERNHFSF